MKMYKGVKALLQAFLVSALDGGQLQTPAAKRQEKQSPARTG
jgi:hypothetical protein